ncbi:iqgap- protein, partial [Coemansia sp. RSA 1972]
MQLALMQAELDNLGANMLSFHIVDSSIGSCHPRLSRIVCLLMPADINENNAIEDDKEEYADEPTAQQFDEDVSYLDDPDIDHMQKTKLYWEQLINIVIQYQQSARQRLAECVVEEKRQAQHYLRMVELATVMQSMSRMVLACRELLAYRDEELRHIKEEEQRLMSAEEQRLMKAEEHCLQIQCEEEAVLQCLSEREMQDQLKSEPSELERHIVDVQALVQCHSILVRREVGNWLTMWGRIEAGVRQVQALARGHLVWQRLREHRIHLKRNINVIVKMQNMYRAKLAGKVYHTLTVEDTPPTPRLIQSCTLTRILEEELELERLRQKAVRQIRENQQTGRILDHLDIKIALLVRNRISLEEVLKQTKRHFRFLDEIRRPVPGSARGMYPPPVPLAQTGGPVPANSLYSLRNMDKESRRKLEGYQHLFYLLQTQPVYLARLLFLLNQGGSRAMRQSMLAAASSASMAGSNAQLSQRPSTDANSGEDISISKLIETIVLTLFGFAQNAREEYLLLKLFCAAIQIELSSISTLQEFLRGNPIFIKLAVHYNRGAKERKYLRDLLQPLIRKVIDDVELDLESDPLVIYRTLIREEESRTGEKSRRAYDITREDALNDMETRTTFIRHLRQLRVLADEFIAAIQQSLNQMPYGMRYIARELRRALTAKFPDEPEAQVMKVVGHLVYYRYINPAIVAPESFDVIETTISPLQRKNLAEIAKMLNQVSVGKHFSEDNMFLQPLNNYVGYTSAKFLSYSFAVTDV